VLTDCPDETRDVVVATANGIAIIGTAFAINASTEAASSAVFFWRQNIVIFFMLHLLQNQIPCLILGERMLASIEVASPVARPFEWKEIQ
jgi:hypothetical protein